MKWEVGKFDRQTIIVFQFLDTPGDEVAPGSDKVGKDFENKRFRHKSSFRRVLTVGAQHAAANLVRL
jgi:hypothetical protein